MNALLVILEGPQGCGKTTAAPFIAQAFGCTEIYADEPSRNAVETALYEGRRVVVCVSGDFCSDDEYSPADEATPVLRIRIEGDRPTHTVATLLAALTMQSAIAREMLGTLRLVSPILEAQRAQFPRCKADDSLDVVALVKTVIARAEAA